MNYIVMECYPSFAVLLDEDGRFHKAANLRYCVGDTVTDPVLMHDTRPLRRRINLWPYAAGALAACLTLLLAIFLYQSYMLPVSSIVLRINPEVRMDLNRSGNVVGLRALNEEGILLLADYDGHGKDGLTVSRELIDRAIAMGYLTTGGKVTVSINAPDDTQFEYFGTTLRQGIAAHLPGEMNVTVRIYDAHTVVLPDLPAASGTDDRYGDDDDDDDDDD